MDCPVCNHQESRVEKTLKGSKTIRQRACQCGARWMTVEKLINIVRGKTAGLIRVPIDPSIISAVLTRDGHRCRYCGRGDVKIGLDHVVPLSAPVTSGRTREDEAIWRNGADNLVACCKPCNSRKGNKLNVEPPELSNGQIQPLMDIERYSSLNNDLSDPDLSLTPLEDPDPAKKEITRSDRARARKRPIDYPDAFAVFWDNIGSTRSKGLKSEALRAWEIVGKPPASVLISQWGEYLRSLGDTFPKDVCRWLKLRGWEEHYGDNIIRNVPLKTRETHAALSRYLERTEGGDNGP